MNINKKWAIFFLFLGLMWWLWKKFKWLVFTLIIGYVLYLVLPPVWSYLNTFTYHWSWWYLIPIFILAAIISDGFKS
jgi:hypothetical protein